MMEVATETSASSAVSAQPAMSWEEMAKRLGELPQLPERERYSHAFLNPSDFAKLRQGLGKPVEASGGFFHTSMCGINVIESDAVEPGNVMAVNQKAMAEALSVPKRMLVLEESANHDHAEHDRLRERWIGAKVSADFHHFFKRWVGMMGGPLALPRNFWRDQKRRTIDFSKMRRLAALWLRHELGERGKRRFAKLAYKHGVGESMMVIRQIADGDRATGSLGYTVPHHSIQP